MTSIEVPYSIAAALPDALGDGHHERRPQRGRRARRRDGIAYVSRDARRSRSCGCRSGRPASSRISSACSSGSSRRRRRSRERLVAIAARRRAREQVPFSDGALCLGRWQRIMLFSLDAEHRTDWQLTLLG